MIHILFQGTFSPFTPGHLSVIKSLGNYFGKNINVIVSPVHRNYKKYSLQETTDGARIAQIVSQTKDIPYASVDLWETQQDGPLDSYKVIEYFSKKHKPLYVVYGHDVWHDILEKKWSNTSFLNNKDLKFIIMCRSTFNLHPENTIVMNSGSTTSSSIINGLKRRNSL